MAADGCRSSRRVESNIDATTPYPNTESAAVAAWLFTDTAAEDLQVVQPVSNKRGRETALLTGEAILVGDLTSMAAVRDSGDGTAREGFVDVVSVIGTTIPFA